MLEVNSYYISAYAYEDKEGKLLLKLWKYSVDAGLTDAYTFEEYKNTFLMTDVVALIKGYCIDISDIGSIDDCIHILIKMIKRGRVNV